MSLRRIRCEGWVAGTMQTTHLCRESAKYIQNEGSCTAKAVCDVHARNDATLRPVNEDDVKAWGTL